LRDKEQREVDFCVTIDGEAQFLVEVKRKSEKISKNLRYFKEKLGTKQNYQVIVDPDKEVDFEQ